MGRFPETVFEQTNRPYGGEILSARGVEFHQEVRRAFETNNIPLIDSTFRVKTQTSIEAKLKRRGLLRWRYLPIADLYGVRAIADGSNIQPAVEAIVRHFNPPDKYPWGLDYIIDHRNPDRHFLYSHPDYKAVHLYVPFGNREVIDIGEIQLMTPQWKQIADATRTHFEQRQGRV